MNRTNVASRSSGPKGKKSPRTPAKKSRNDSHIMSTPRAFPTVDLDDLITPKGKLYGSYNSVASSLFNSSIDFDPRLESILHQILIFRDSENVERHSIDKIMNLINAGAKCAPDAKYLLLTIPARLITNGAKPEKKDLVELISKAKNLLRPNVFFKTFGEKQDIPRNNLKMMIKLFNGTLENQRPEDLDISRTDTFNVSVIERFVANKYNKINDNASQNSIQQFLNDTSSTADRIDLGQDILNHISDEEKEELHNLAAKFCDWANAYSAVKDVWDSMKLNSNFQVNALLAIIPISYADFMVEGLRTFADEEGMAPPVMYTPI